MGGGRRRREGERKWREEERGLEVRVSKNRKRWRRVAAANGRFLQGVGF